MNSERKMIKLEKHDRYHIELNVRDRVELIKGDGTCNGCVYDKERAEKESDKDVICEGVAHICESGAKGHFIKDTNDKERGYPLKLTCICKLY